MRAAQRSPVSLLDAAAALKELWSPRVIAQVNDHFLKVVRVAGEFPWHSHDNEEELFLVLRGTLRIGRAESDGGPVDVHAGECFVVPRGVRHNTATPDGSETLLALFEPTGTLHTGTEQTAQTRSIAEQMR